MRTVEGVAAVVLKRTEYGESDLVLSLYCRSLGKISALAPAGRRSRKRFGAALGLFTLSVVSLTSKPKSDLWTLTLAEPRHSFAGLSLDVTTMAHGSYGTELVRELCADEHPDSDVFDLLLDLYESLDQSGPKAGRLRVFEMRLLAILGLAPMLANCISCGEEHLPGGVWMVPEQGGVSCGACFAKAESRGARRLTEGAWRLLVRAQDLHQLADGDVLDGLPDAPIARGAMLALLYCHVGKPLKSVEFIAKLSKGR